MEQFTEIDKKSALVLLGIDYKNTESILNRLASGVIPTIHLPSITGHEIRVREGKIILYQHS